MRNDLVQNRPAPDGYTTFAQFANDFFNPLTAAYSAIQAAINEPNVANIQAALDALPEGLTLSGEPGLDKDAVQAQLDTFATLEVLKQPILDAVAGASAVDSLVGLLDAFSNEAPGVAAEEMKAATTVTEVKAILDDVFVFVSGATADTYQSLSTEAQNVLAVALLQSEATDFEGLAQDFEDTLARLEALSETRTQAVVEDVNDDLQAFGGNEPTSLDDVIAAREDVQVAVEGLVDTANESVTTTTFVNFTGGDKKSGGAFAIEGTGPARTVTGFELVITDDRSVLSASNSGPDVGSAQFDENGTLIGFSLIPSQGDPIESIGDGSVTGVSVSTEAGQFEVDVEVTSQVESQQVDLSVASFQAVQAALQAVVDENLRETLADGTLVEDISVADLDAAIAQFGDLSQATQTDTLAAVQAGDGYTTLGSVLGAFEPAIQGVPLDALNAATDPAGVLDVLADAAILYPAEFTSFDALEGDSQTFAASVLLANQGYASFADAEAAFGQSVALVQAAEAFLGAANAADVAGLSDALDAALAAIGDLTVPGALKADIAAAKTALDDLAPGRDQAAANDLKDNGGAGWTLSDLYTGNMLALGARLVEFRAVLEESINAAEGGNFARGADGTLEGVLAALQAVEGQKADATINGFGIAGIITDKQALIDTVNGLSPDGRFDAFAADLAANGPYSSFTDIIGTLEPLLGFREDVQTAVEAGKAGTLDVAELAAVRDSLAALDGKKVNGEEVDETAVKAEFDALIGRVNELVPGRFVALQNDLEANGGSFTSFQGMIGLFDGLLRVSTPADIRHRRNSCRAQRGSGS